MADSALVAEKGWDLRSSIWLAKSLTFDGTRRATASNHDVSIECALGDLQSGADVVQANRLVLEKFIGENNSPIVWPDWWAATFVTSGAGRGQPRVCSFLN